MRRSLRFALALLACVPTGGPALGYPLDASEETGIARLEAYSRAREGLLARGTLKNGSLLRSDQIQLGLLAAADFSIPPPDPGLTAKLLSLLGAEAPRYGVTVLDLTDPEKPRYAEHRPDALQNPGSVGKLMVALAWFQALADLYPDDVAARRGILFETRVRADAFIVHDHHVVPFWKPGDPKVAKRPIREGDTANLWTYLDWMCSSSSNAAASVLMAQLVLLAKFGHDYPVPPEVADAFFEKTSKLELQRIFFEAIQTPVTRNGLDLERLRQGSFFTREGKRRVPGTSSHATSRELLRYMVLLEQGKLVDPFSSLEIKKLLYLTDRRIRYASSHALFNSAVYFKSGSLYSCKEEPGFECKKYHGNVKNYMNSATIVETHDPNQPLHYIVVVLSNVLRKNSAVAHQTLATRIHRLMEADHPPSSEPAAVSGEAPPRAPAAKSDRK